MEKLSNADREYLAALTPNDQFFDDHAVDGKKNNYGRAFNYTQLLILSPQKI